MDITKEMFWQAVIYIASCVVVLYFVFIFAVYAVYKITKRKRHKGILKNPERVTIEIIK